MVPPIEAAASADTAEVTVDDDGPSLSSASRTVLIEVRARLAAALAA
ncbi:MAG: hypothetical protein ACMVO5_06185 [Polymorphobacter sp.]